MKKQYTEPAFETTRITLKDVILYSGEVTPTEPYETPRAIRRAMEEELENNGEMVENPVD
ncbi:MAG: hypothetical protein IJJ15_09600 [Ruminococcus sp.]|nr:hypothetical protein [Ruminococcus sp.]